MFIAVHRPAAVHTALHLHHRFDLLSPRERLGHQLARRLGSFFMRFPDAEINS